MKQRIACLLLPALFLFGDLAAQVKLWQQGLVKHEAIFDSASFPESHAATIAQTRQGLVAAWFGGTKERNPDVEIWMSRLVSGAWTKPYSVADGRVNDTLRYACWNPVLYQVPAGDLLLFYKTGPNVARWKGWMKSSSDGGKTWSEAKALEDEILGPVKNKPIQVGNTIIAPSSTEGKGWHLHFETSTDKGRTWSRQSPFADTAPDAIQPTLLRYGSGRLQVLARSKKLVMMEAWSDDGGKTWSELKPGPLPNNNSGFDAVTLRSGRQVLVYNHVRAPDSAKNGKGLRTPLNLAYSDEGKTWYAAMIIEDSPISQYSYPSVIEGADGMIHIVYTWRRQKIKYAKVDPKKLKGVKIVDGTWPSRAGYTAPSAVEGQKPQE